MLLSEKPRQRSVYVALITAIASLIGTGFGQYISYLERRDTRVEMAENRRQGQAYKRQRKILARQAYDGNLERQLANERRLATLEGKTQIIFTVISMPEAIDDWPEDEFADGEPFSSQPPPSRAVKAPSYTELEAQIQEQHPLDGLLDELSEE